MFLTSGKKFAFVLFNFYSRNLLFDILGIFLSVTGITGILMTLVLLAMVR